MYIQPWQKLLNQIIKPLWSFVKIDLNIQWSLFTENKHTMLLLSMICQHKYYENYI